jgi:7-keto-8-aminopelargonate synthetase-like enzyme
MCKRLQEEGVFVNPIVSPAVPPGGAMLRTSYMATHTREHLERALAAFAKVGRELGVIQ